MAAVIGLAMQLCAAVNSCTAAASAWCLVVQGRVRTAAAMVCVMRPVGTASVTRAGQVITALCEPYLLTVLFS